MLYRLGPSLCKDHHVEDSAYYNPNSYDTAKKQRDTRSSTYGALQELDAIDYCGLLDLVSK